MAIGVILLLVFVVFVRDGCVSGCVGLILGPFILLFGAAVLVKVLEWLL